jgi:hypothetical protein
LDLSQIKKSIDFYEKDLIKVDLFLAKPDEENRVILKTPKIK